MFDINLEHYRAFYFVAKYSSISKAANALFLTQPAVSKSIQKLENYMGVSLFERNSNGMNLTEAGSILFEHVAKAFNELDAGELSVQKLSKEYNGNLRIGATESAIYNYLIPILKNYQAMYPNIAITIVGSNTYDLCKSLKASEIDIAFFVSPLPDEIKFPIIFLKEIQDVFIANHEFEHLKDIIISPAQLIKYPVICVASGTSARNHIDSWFQNLGVNFHPNYTVRTSSLVIPFIQNGLGIGIVPENFVTETSYLSNMNDIFIINTTDSIPPRNLYLSINDKLPISSACREFIALSKKYLLK